MRYKIEAVKAHNINRKFSFITLNNKIYIIANL